ncbi:hypothetical protein PYW08_005672 [Mythimna loreyi]|uniref:Uncharacterized protein n=1 Tax=Mythimna loreyi TaxID=667449 RepID=A0ACC2QH77_9NEOP|nr:hypothetical protein PYW08_005672 [Mythimna loreyi]
MWTQVITFSAILTIVLSVTEVPGTPGIQREFSKGVQSKGYKIVYGDEDLTIINQVVSEVEKGNVLKNRVNLNEAIKPLPAQDVKCLMSVDRYCSKKMGAMKSVLIQAIKEDCAKCSAKQKNDAGMVIASMMAHDPVAWKLFLTRSALQIIPRKPHKEIEEVKLREIGEGEEVIRPSKNRFIMPGGAVRVKRYVSEKIP